MTRLFYLIVCCLLLSACAMRGKEVPDNDAAGSDAMKISPCACAQIDWKGADYEWIG